MIRIKSYDHKNNYFDDIETYSRRNMPENDATFMNEDASLKT